MIKLPLQYLKHVRSLPGLLHWDTGPINNTVFLTGTGRSGTTWIQDVINYDNNYRVMFEPFHNRRLALLKGWNNRQYLRPDDETPFRDAINQILTGRVRSLWVDRFNKQFLPGKRLIKDIRTHFIMRWVNVHYPDIPQILLMRHPCAIALSKIQLGWHPDLTVFTSQKELIGDFFEPFIPVIESASTDFEKHLIQWCVENYVPLCQFGQGELLVCVYEHFCETPEPAVRRLFSFLGQESPDKALAVMNIASPMARKHSAINQNKSRTSGWRATLSGEQIKAAASILSAFGFDRIYSSSSSMPLVSEDEILSLFA